MRATTLIQFDDKKAGLRRIVGEEFTVSRDRFDEINATGMAKIGKPLVAEAEPKRARKGAR